MLHTRGHLVEEHALHLEELFPQVYVHDERRLMMKVLQPLLPVHGGARP